MYGMSAAYIHASKGVTCPDMRKFIRYCVVDSYVINAMYRKFFRKGFKCL